MGHPDCMSVTECEQLCAYCKDYKEKKVRFAEEKVVAEAKKVLIERGWVLLPPPNSGLDILKK